ncbi:DUF4190 domain-containing protein [Pseudolysinimonas yzui]|uniref:DUF4190 domain-containing protein n=1 Tax=Pseudolysinimonas yzui TaxID=2708254 RepID=A0A8J3GRM3_9MICO|nr:DUF4190 domain-containing protein [Pseudolysinimonas yzui]GHF20465.1 hypothetical protein GCM10011600_21800 [Pseudolysinimonas yzui]
MTDPQPPVPPVPSPDGATPPPAPPAPPAAPAAPAAQPTYPAYGQPPAAGYYAPPTNTLAILALVLAFVIAPGGIICGHIALSQIKRTGEGGRGLAVAGLIIGYVFTGIFVLYIIGVIIFAVWMASMGAAYSTYPY